MKKWIPVFLALASASVLWGHGISDADKLAIAEGGNLRYLWLGAVHMVTGYDHILFLFGVIFYLTGLKDIFKFITAFTLGHSITLIMATFMKITANFYLIDAVIALSVCYKAFDNLDGFRKYLKFNPPHLLAMVFLFGLIHGFGLSARLQDLPLPEQGLLLRILSFNVGVELGQIAALSVLVALLAGWRKTESFRKLGGIANMLLLAAGVGLFIYQVNGYLRGGDHHDEEIHDEGSEGHSHGEGTHTHGEDAHAHPAPDMALDTAGLHDHAAPGHETSTHPHGGEEHVHAPEDGPRPKRPPVAPPKTHSHDEGVPHEH